jgi:hypothetical protein
MRQGVFKKDDSEMGTPKHVQIDEDTRAAYLDSLGKILAATCAQQFPDDYNDRRQLFADALQHGMALLYDIDFKHLQESIMFGFDVAVKINSLPAQNLTTADIFSLSDPAKLIELLNLEWQNMELGDLQQLVDKQNPDLQALLSYTVWGKVNNLSQNIA